MTVERISRAPECPVRRLCACALLLLVLATSAVAQTLPQGSPVLLTEGTGVTTRGVAYEAVTFRSEPFPVISPFNWNADKSNTRDQQTRVTLFAMNLALLPGECGRDAAPNCSMPLSADAQDASGRIYPLRVESITRPRYVQLQPVPGNPSRQEWAEVTQDWLYAVTVRLDDAMTDTLGDVLVRINLHGLASNRVRIAIGQNGAGPATDSATEFASPAPATPPAPTPTPTPKQYGPGEASAADATRLLEQATWGPTSSEVTRVQQIGLRAFVDEQFAAAVLNPAKGSDFPDLPFVLDDQSQQCGTDANCLRDGYSIYPVQKQFFTNTLTRPAQLRQRVAFALHQIFVVSNRDIPFPHWMTPYLQALDRNAFGNYRTLLEDVTLNPAMGEYLDMRRSVAHQLERELRARDSATLLARREPAQPRRDARARRAGCAHPRLHPDDGQRVHTRLHGLEPRRRPSSRASSNYRDPMVPRGVNNTHDVAAKTLFSTSISACPSSNGAQNSACARTRHDDRAQHHLQPPERRPLHLAPAHPAPRDEQPLARLRRSASPRPSTTTATASTPKAPARTRAGT